MANKMNVVHEARVIVRWRSDSRDGGACREIARDIRGTINRDFGAFISSRKGMLIMEVRSTPDRTTRGPNESMRRTDLTPE